MYGTIAKVTIDPSQLDELKALSQTIGSAPGQMARYVFQMDADPSVFYLIAVFESREAYWANAHSPEQNERYMQMRALFTSDPEWHDGEIVDVAA
jgi:quinol monooxygenase YgiN